MAEIRHGTITIATGILKNPYLDTLSTSLGQLGQKLENRVRFGKVRFGLAEISCGTITIATGIPKNPYLDTLGTSLGQLGQKLENHVRFG